MPTANWNRYALATYWYFPKEITQIPPNPCAAIFVEHLPIGEYSSPMEHLVVLKPPTFTLPETYSQFTHENSNGWKMLEDDSCPFGAFSYFLGCFG